MKSRCKIAGLAVALWAGGLAGAFANAADQPETTPFDCEKLALFTQWGDGRLSHCSSMTSLALLSDGKRVVSTSQDNTARLWDLASGQELQRYPSTESVWSALVLPGEKRLLTCGEDKLITLWDLASGAKLKTYDQQETVFRLCLMPDGKRFAACGKNKKVCLWDIESGNLLRSFEGQTKDVYSVAVTPDGKLLAVSGEESMVRLYDPETGVLIRTLTGHADAVCTLAVSPDGKTLASCSDDHTARLWVLDTGKELWKAEIGKVKVIAFSPDGARIAVTEDSKSARLLKAADGSEEKKIEHDGLDNHWPVVFSADGKRLLNGGFRIDQWDAADGKLLPLSKPVAGHLGPVSTMAQSPDGGTLYSGGADEKIHVWNVKDGAQVAEWKAAKAIKCLAISADGQKLISSDDKKQIIIWDAKTGAQLRKIDLERSAYSMVLSSDGDRLLVADSREMFAVFNAATGDKIRDVGREEGDSDDIEHLAAMPCGALAVSGSDKGSVRVWNHETGRLLAELKVPLEKFDVTALVLSSSGRQLLAGGRVEKENLLCAWRCPESAVEKLAPEKLRALIAGLASEEFEVRIKSVEQLIKAGKPVLPLLEKVDSSRDAELKDRIGQVRGGLAAAELPLRIAGNPLKLEGRIRSLVMHRDGKHWAAVIGDEADARIVLGELTQAGLSILRTIEDGHGARCLLFSPDCETLYAGNGNSTISVYRLPLK
jgi:WD40 repeat protein